MIGWMPPRQERRKPIRADFLNEMAQRTAAHSKLKAGAGLGQRTMFGTPVLEYILSYFILPAKTGGSTIAALSGSTPGSGTVTLYKWDGTSFSLGARTVTARNVYGSAVPANKLVWLARWGNSYWVVTVAC